MRTQYYTATSLDGFIADADHSLEWLFQFGSDPDEVDDSYGSFMDNVGAIAMGSSTYEWLLRHEFLADPDNPKPWSFTQPTWVFSTRALTVLPDADIRFVRGDVRPVHQAMTEAANGKNIWLCGGGDLVGQFHDHGLLDELIVFVASVTLGSGAPLLPRRIVTPPLKLTSAKKLGNAMVRLTYDVQRG